MSEHQETNRDNREEYRQDTILNLELHAHHWNELDESLAHMRSFSDRIHAASQSRAAAGS